MWSYGSPAFTDSAAPRLLRQLKKVDQRSGVGGNAHSKVVGLAVSSGGRVLWSVGKATISLWSTHSRFESTLLAGVGSSKVGWLLWCQLSRQLNSQMRLTFTCLRPALRFCA